MLSILAIGRDERLLDTRSAVLRRTKAEVTQAKPEAGVRLLQTTRFDLVILCHSLSLEESIEIAEAAHRRPEGVHVLQVITGALWGQNYEGVPVDGLIESDPERLVEKVVVLSKRMDCLPLKDGNVLNFRTGSERAN
ncbi:hypothetical protein [Granulicella sp. dw_53]|uniref:hypothetical protein n=1 Tax=Granulicella sp. dw_53 TaxID=2719792 RepID=UPI001BD2E80A|nr:hypothetical protein [Granulicella sp. dw_53]